MVELFKIIFKKHIFVFRVLTLKTPRCSLKSNPFLQFEMLFFCSVNRVIISSVALLNVGEAEKAAQAPVKAEDEPTAESCGCNKPCNCSKATACFSDLYSTGKSPHITSLSRAQINLKKGQLPRYVTWLYYMVLFDF